MQTLSEPPDVPAVVDFLNGIGIETKEGPPSKSSGPNVCMAGGHIVYRSGVHAGDLLRKAAHIAVTPSIFRPLMTEVFGDLKTHFNTYLMERGGRMATWPDDPVGVAMLHAGETEANAWAYAAAVAAKVDTMLPFSMGFGSDAQAVHDRISSGAYFGIDGLVRGGMTKMPGAAQGQDGGFPTMLRWLQI